MATARKIAAPTTLKIFNLTYKVRFVDTMEADGWCDFDRQEIVLAEGQSREALADTFLHETIHAVGRAMGVDWKDEESAVGTMATGLTTFWQANPGARRWWASLL
tara:strand:- start:181 stop:495 length:315 start_codon:yes stop_codon:yes gene_type:complete